MQQKQQKKIVYVEDNDFCYSLAQAYLNQTNYSLSRASDGVQGIKKALDDSIDLLLLDIRLPKKNGFEVLKEVRMYKPDLPIIMISADVFSETQNEALALGANGFISKPYSHTELLSTINNYLEKPSVFKEKYF